MKSTGNYRLPTGNQLSPVKAGWPHSRLTTRLTLCSYIFTLLLYFTEPWLLNVLYLSPLLRQRSPSLSAPRNSHLLYQASVFRPNLKVSQPLVIAGMHAQVPPSLPPLVPVLRSPRLETQTPRLAEHLQVRLLFLSARHMYLEFSPLRHSFIHLVLLYHLFLAPIHPAHPPWLLPTRSLLYTTANRLLTPRIHSSR